MAYTLLKNGLIRSSTTPVLVYTTPDTHGAVVTLRFIPPGSETVRVSVFIRTAGGQDDLPVAYDCEVSAGKPFELKGIYIHGRRTLVIQSTGNVDWIMDGFGQVSPTSNDLPQGRMLAASGWKPTGNQFMTLDIPDALTRITNASECDFFLSGRVAEPTRIDVKVANTILTNDTQFNGNLTYWLFTTVLKPDVPTRILRKITFGFRYINFKIYREEPVAAYVQYNLKDHNLL